MIKFQKVIKYIAIALAILLIFNIFRGILMVVGGIVGVSKIGDVLEEDTNYELLEEPEVMLLDEDATEIEIEVATVNINIKQGEKFSFETNSKNMWITRENDTILIREKTKVGPLVHSTNLGEATIYIPKNVEIAKIKLETGAGNVNISDLNLQEVDFELGAGNVKLQNIISNNKCKIEGGAGKIEISDSEFKNMNLDLGVGNLDLNAKLIGNSSINCGVGQLNLNLIGNVEDYKIDVEKGIGTAKIKDDDISGTYSNGDNYIDIEGGVGAINIDFQNVE